jgi:PAS domain S-box-containing protein
MQKTQISSNSSDQPKNLFTESQNHQESLENIVKERTAQLEQAIADLQKETQERLKVEKSLRASRDQLLQQEEFFSLVIDSNPNLIFVKDWDGRYLLANQTMAEFYNTTVENLLGKTDADFHPNILESERFIQENHQIIETQQDLFLTEERITHAELGYQWLQWQKRPIKIFGNIDGVLGEGVNITERKLTEISLSESQKRFESLAAVAPVGIYRTNTTGDAIYLNDRWCQIAGLTAAEAFGPNWSRALHPDDRQKVGAEWYASVQERRPFELECRFQKPDGTITWVLSRASAERDIYGEIIGYVGTITDISDRKRAETTLQKLVIGTAAVTGADFFVELVRHIAEALEVRYAIITEFVGDRLISLAFSANGILQDPISYLPARTPCEICLREGEYHCDQSVQQIFLEDLDLVTMQAESYLGISLKDDRGSAIGNLCILDTKPIPKSKRDEAIAILQVFAARASAELQRKNANEALNRLNQELEMRVQQRTQELQERERFLQTVLDSFPLAVFWKDRQSVYLGCNQLFAEISGVESPLQAIGKTNFDFSYTEEEAQKYLEDDQAVMDSEISKIGLEETITLANGEVNWIETNKIPLRDELGEVVGVVGTFQDISDRKQAEAKLHQLNEELIRATRLKDEFLANMSHELRTPLNAILGMTEGLLDGIFGAVNEKQIKSLKIVERSGTHLLSLINDILDVAKIESGKVTLDLRATSIQSLCQSSLSFIKQEALNKRIQIVEKVPKFLSGIMLDERRIRQVLINLLNNAVKFTPERGSITLEVAQISLASSGRASSTIAPDSASRNTSRNTSRNNLQYLKFAVTDTGIGISDENIQKLFQPFIQIDSSLNRQYNGTGLGLALVKRLVELHGGWVELTSKIGMGSCFAIFLPYDNAALVPLNNQVVKNLTSGQEPLTNLPPSSAPQSRLILLAEDNQANVITVASYLTAKGYRIQLAQDGQEAVNLAKLHRPDVILMDIQMPVMDGFTAIQQIRLDANLSKIPIIALTALAMEGDREKCLAAGANDYLSKPIRLKSLAEMIDSYFTN